MLHTLLETAQILIINYIDSTTINVSTSANTKLGRLELNNLTIKNKQRIDDALMP